MSQSMSSNMVRPTGVASTASTGGSQGTPGNVQAELGQMMQMLMTMMQSFSGGAPSGGFPNASVGSPQSLMSANPLGGGAGLMAGSLGGGGMSGVSIGGTIGGVPIPTVNGQLGPQGLAAIDMGLNNTVGIIQNSLSSVRLSI
jgi:hypothetical protein